jgi:hypothetical protein
MYWVVLLCVMYILYKYPIDGLSTNVQANRVELHGGTLLQVAQILVYTDNDKHLQYGDFSNIQASSIYKSYTTPDNAFDTNTSYLNYPHVYHSSGGESNSWIAADFTTSNVSSVVLYNRADCCWERLGNTVLKLLYNGHEVKSINITPSMAQQAIITLSMN